MIDDLFLLLGACTMMRDKWFVLTILLLTRLRLRPVTVSVKIPFINLPVYDMMSCQSLDLERILFSCPGATTLTYSHRNPSLLTSLYSLTHWFVHARNAHTVRA